VSTSVPEPSAPVPAHLARIVDDAAVFPPGNMPLPEALAAHREHRNAPYADLVGPLLVSDLRLPALRELLAGTGSAVATTVVVSGGAGALAPAVRWAGGAEGLELAGVEMVLRDEDDLRHNALRVVAAVDELLAGGALGDEVPVYVEPPRLRGAEPSHSWLAALDEIAAPDHRLKFRTGGSDADAFPSAAELASCIEAALDRELRFKCTAGLHHAVRHRVAEGFERPVDQHGFLNVLLATRASLDGASHADLVDVLEETDAATVADRVRQAGPEALASARRWFTGFGSCSVLEPIEDLIALGLLPHDLAPRDRSRSRGGSDGPLEQA
jgi:hypothetical protein